MEPQIYVFIAYCGRNEGPGKHRGRNLPAAIDRYMRVVPEDDWGLLLDHDIAFTTRSWYRVLERAIEENPEAGMFICKTNRLRPRRSRFQMCGDPNCHDMVEMHRVGLELERTWGASVKDVTHVGSPNGPRYASGLFMCFRKSTWRRIYEMGRLPSFPDYEIHRRVAALGLKVLLLEGVFVYHWFRGRPLPCTVSPSYLTPRLDATCTSSAAGQVLRVSTSRALPAVGLSP